MWKDFYWRLLKNDHLCQETWNIMENHAYNFLRISLKNPHKFKIYFCEFQKFQSFLIWIIFQKSIDFFFAFFLKLWLSFRAFGQNCIFLTLMVCIKKFKNIIFLELNSPLAFNIFTNWKIKWNLFNCALD